jgi:hypothetical protein
MPRTPDIQELFAFISDDNGEGVAAYLGPDGIWMPMVGADQARVDSLRPMAQELAKMSGVKVTLARFSTRENIEDFEP